MAHEQMRPTSKKLAPDPAHSYERADPNHECGMGRLDNNDDAVPTSKPDHIENAVTNKQDTTRQLNGEDVANQRHSVKSTKVDHSLLDEEGLKP